MKLSPIIGIVSVVAVFALAVTVLAEDPAPTAPAAAAVCKAQTLCPIDGKAIDKACCADVEGSRVYCCCQACVDKVKADPKAALEKVAGGGETCEKAPAEAAAPAPK